MKKKDMEDLDLLPVDHQFDILLYRKTMEKTTTQRTSMNKYYRDIYNKTGVIPEGLFYREGRKASGRKRSLSKEIEKYFIKMVKKSANDDVNSPDFITKKLRTVVNFHRRLEEKYGKISIDALYRLVSKHGLRKYFDKLDYTDDECNKILEYFDDIPTFDKIQIDGCRFKYIEIKDDNNNWKRPCVIEFLDTGSRFMLSMDIYFSESNESSVDIFSKFLKSTAFPKKKIQLRPDNAKAFLNLKRPVKELNHKYSFPDEFYFDNDFAKIRKPKNKDYVSYYTSFIHFMSF